MSTSHCVINSRSNFYLKSVGELEEYIILRRFTSGYLIPMRLVLEVMGGKGVTRIEGRICLSDTIPA